MPLVWLEKAKRQIGWSSEWIRPEFDEIESVEKSQAEHSELARDQELAQSPDG
jgi:hypothetical protein